MTFRLSKSMSPWLKDTTHAESLPFIVKLMLFYEIQRHLRDFGRQMAECFHFFVFIQSGI